MEDKESVRPVWFKGEYTKYPKRPEEIEEVWAMLNIRGEKKIEERAMKERKSESFVRS